MALLRIAMATCDIPNCTVQHKVEDIDPTKPWIEVQIAIRVVDREVGTREERPEYYGRLECHTWLVCPWDQTYALQNTITQVIHNLTHPEQVVQATSED